MFADASVSIVNAESRSPIVLVCESSEIYDIPDNRNLSQEDRTHRVETVYRPFQAALRQVMSPRRQGVLVTIHSFTPVYHGRKHDVELGILHDTDTRLADAMLAGASRHTQLATRRNEPYAARDGVTHTLAENALPRGWPNVMLEIRNDLIDTQARQSDIARQLRSLLVDALDRMAFDPLPVSRTAP